MINMFVMRDVVLLVLVGLVLRSGGLQQLADGEDNDILTAEEQLRATTNTLFSLLRLHHPKTRPRIQQYSLVHNYFISLTLQDYNTLRDISKLTRVDKQNNENITATFIVLLNEIVDDENILAEVKKVYDLDDEIREFEFLKSHYIDPIHAMNINKDVLNLLEDDGPPDKTSTTSTEVPLSPPNNKNNVDSEILKLMYNDDNAVFNNESSTTSNIDATNTDHTEDGFWREEDSLPIQRRIFGGKSTNINNYPFMASVEIFKKFQCGGSIIKDDLVLTAASCLQLAWNNRFYRENPAFLSVRIGTVYIENGGESVPILEVYFYPSYDPQKLTHNLAVMRLHRRIRWHKRVKKIQMDQLESPLALNTDGILILGWGARTSSNIILSTMKNKMQYAILDIYPLDDCQAIYSKEYVTRKHFCAGFISVGGGACNRDVGGPGVVSGMLTGVVSFGAPECGRADSPTVFTKVGYYYDWIEEIMEQDVLNIRKGTTLHEKIIYYTSENTDTDHWTETPIYTRSIATTDDIAVETKLREKGKVNFKDFLKTMFNSAEIDEYFDTIKKAGHKNVATGNVSTTPALRMPATTESSDDEQRVTRLGDDATWSPASVDKNNAWSPALVVDNINDDDDDDDDTLALPYERDTTTTVANLEMFDVVDQDSVDEDKELEERILKIVNEADIAPPSGPNPAHKKETISGKISEKIAKEKIDDAILALLYLSDSEKESTNTTKPDKKNYTVDSIENDDYKEEETTPRPKLVERDVTVENSREDKKYKERKRKAKKYKKKVSRWAETVSSEIGTKSKKSKKKVGRGVEPLSSETGTEQISRDGIMELFNRDGNKQIIINETDLSTDSEVVDDVDDVDDDRVNKGIEDFLNGNLLFEIFQENMDEEVNNTVHN